MAVIDMKSLLETGVHFGHRTRKWNPRMKPYIFTQRNGIHIIDLQQTLRALELAYAVVRDSVAQGGRVLFVGTKRQAQDTIEVESRRCGMAYVNSRWLGGTLTNWRTIRSSIDELEALIRSRDEGVFENLTKKEASLKVRRIEQLEERLGGIRDMRALPKLIYVVDVRKEETAVHEANLLSIPVIALVDTNCDPTGVDYVIPSNDDAIRAIKLLTSKIADAVLEGRALRKDEEEEAAEEGLQIERAFEVEMSDEELLGDATLAKLGTGAYDEAKAAARETDEEQEEPQEPEDSSEQETDDQSQEDGEDEKDDDDDDARRPRPGNRKKASSRVRNDEPDDSEDDD